MVGSIQHLVEEKGGKIQSCSCCCWCLTFTLKGGFLQRLNLLDFLVLFFSFLSFATSSKVERKEEVLVVVVVRQEGHHFFRDRVFKSSYFLFF